MGVDKGLNTKHTFQWVATDDKSLLACAIKTQFYQRKECSFDYVYFNMGVLIVGDGGWLECSCRRDSRHKWIEMEMAEESINHE